MGQISAPDVFRPLFFCLAVGAQNDLKSSGQANQKLKTTLKKRSFGRKLNSLQPKMSIPFVPQVLKVGMHVSVAAFSFVKPTNLAGTSVYIWRWTIKTIRFFFT